MQYTRIEITNYNSSSLCFISFINSGINDDNYNDYEDIDVTGKIVVAIGGEPKGENNNYLVSGTAEISKWSNNRQELSSKLNTAKEQGAKAFFLINDSMFKLYAPYYRARDEQGGESNLSLDVNEDDAMYGFLVAVSYTHLTLPTIYSV